MKNFGEKLKELREKRNLSQKELGDKMGEITQQTIAQYEKKETVPKFETVSKIANALEINPNIFYSDFSQSTADDSEEIGERIKELRKSKGVSQKELAQKTGLSIGSIQGYEQGRYNPKLEAIVKAPLWANLSPYAYIQTPLKTVCPSGPLFFRKKLVPDCPTGEQKNLVPLNMPPPHPVLVPKFVHRDWIAVAFVEAVPAVVLVG